MGDPYELIEDDPTEEERFGLYQLRGPGLLLHRIATTCESGIGTMVVTLAREGELGDGSRCGILDRIDRKWILLPWAEDA